MGDFYLVLRMVPITFWLMSFGFWALIPIKNEDELTTTNNKYRFYKSGAYLKMSFIISILIYISSIYIKGLYL